MYAENAPQINKQGLGVGIDGVQKGIASAVERLRMIRMRLAGSRPEPAGPPTKAIDAGHLSARVSACHSGLEEAHALISEIENELL